MKREISAAKIFSGLFWSFGERITAQAVTFLVSVILARILLPEDYGLVSLILVFITLANVFVSSGFGESLVRKKDASDQDFQTIFWCSFLFSAVLYGGLYVAAPAIARFYDAAELTAMLRVFALKLPVSAFSTIQHAYVSRHMQFKKFFFSTLGGTIVSGAVGIAMAAMGFGAWAIVSQYLLNSVIDTAVLSFTVPWKPRLCFSVDSAKELMGFGWKMTLSSFLNVGYGEIRSLIIGKQYSSADLAYYKRGLQFPQLVITNINTAISTVLFPVLSMVNDDLTEIKKLTRRSMMTASYLIFPLMTGLAVIARPLVIFLLTEKWLPCVPFLQLACITHGLQPIQTANCQAIRSIGRSDIYLKMELAKKSVGLLLLLLAMQKGVMAIVFADVLAILISTVISVFPNKKLIGYGYWEQIKDLLPALCLSLSMGICILPLGELQLHAFFVILLQVLLGACLYILFSVVSRNSSFSYLLATLRTLRKSGKKSSDRLD